MPVAQHIRDVFAYFHNLNLLTLMHGLRRHEAAHGEWFVDGLLCPVAHGLATGDQVARLAQSQASHIAIECEFAATQLGAKPKAVERFVAAWDDGAVSAHWLVHQLMELWEERLADADALQAVLGGEAAESGGKPVHVLEG